MRNLKHQRLYVIINILAVCLLFLLLWAFVRQPRPVRNRLVTLIMFDPERIKRHPEIFGDPYPPKRNYQLIRLTGNNRVDSLSLDYAQLVIHRMQQEHDTLNGIHLQFERGTRYWTLITALDILVQEGAQSYMVEPADIWFMIYPGDRE
ncbi:UNVERIFIED_ORG: hypothetical protein DFS12_106414 [Chitinophaga ginsengisegetis]